VLHLEERRRQADLVENFESRWMNRIAAEFAVEIDVHFEEPYGHTTAGEEKPEHGTSWTAADYAARSLLNIADFVL
jgi:hypothetical protein